MRVWSDKTEIAADRFVAWIGIARGKFFAWKNRYGKANEHNGHVPRDHWLLDEEKRKIIAFHERFPLEGYRRLAFMMIDQDVVAASPSSVYRMLAAAGLLDRWNKKPSKKGTGFVQPLRPHEHWHIDISYLNLAGTFYYMCSILDGASRSIVHWEIRETMTEKDVECILQTLSATSSIAEVRSRRSGSSRPLETEVPGRDSMGSMPRSQTGGHRGSAMVGRIDLRSRSAPTRTRSPRVRCSCR
ncbi:MAG TPA: DDE-type integrase/transposase/recombinase [Kofleriaceae bacterium]